MSLKSTITHILHPHDGNVIGKVELSLVQHGVAIAKADTGLVGKIEVLIADMTDPTLTGAEKRARVVSDAAPAVLAFIADPSKAIADVIDFTHELVQSVYDDAKSSTAGQIASILVARAAV